MNRRTALGILAGAAPAILIKRASGFDTKGLDIQKGKFEGTRESLKSWEAPRWYRDAKFGIWAHWGPQSAPEFGDWYARNMYIQDSAQYKYHVEHYGHPTKFGFKDIVPTWKGDRFDAEHLIGMYKKAGAKYFVSMGCHHDNFDMWNSKYNKWNAAQMGPKKDIVGLFKKAATKNGLKFGVSEHLWISYKWFAVSHGADKTGPLAGVPYDGKDPKYADLYHDAECEKWSGEARIPFNDDGIPVSWRKHWFDRIRDLVDNYQPDLLYTDGHLPFEEYGLAAVANLYNVSAMKHGGTVEAVYNSKLRDDCVTGTCVLDFERGVANRIEPNVWQTDTCIGNWHYKKDIKYKTPKTVVDMLVDIVSRNGNLLLNFPMPNNGALDPDELKVLEGITNWMAVNSEGIYATRPWKIAADGPATDAAGKLDAKFNERNRKDLSAQDVRFTTKGDKTIFAFLMGWPEGEAVVKLLGTHSPQNPPKIANVQLLGHEGKVEWKQQAEGLKVTLPGKKPSDYAVALKVTTA
jgi:alpha-L-fucosidase